MKKYIILTLFLFIALPAIAYTTNDELTSTEQLINYNFSKEMAEDVQLTKAQNSNREYKSERSQKKETRILNKLFRSLDPNYDDGTLDQHDIRPGSSFFDY